MIGNLEFDKSFHVYLADSCQSGLMKFFLIVTLEFLQITHRKALQ